MKDQLLEQHQLLNLTRTSLEKRLAKHKDAAYAIQAAVFLMVRNFFSVADFSFVAKDTMRELFLNHADELASVRHLCIYFRDYFSDNEWKTVIDSLFISRKEYLQVTETTRLHTEHIRPMLQAGSCKEETQKNLALTFFDETGKKHRCTMKNVHRSYSAQENCDALSILGTLTIFHKDGVRRFTELAKSRFVTLEEEYDCANKEEQPDLWVKHKTTQPAEEPKLSIHLDDPRSLPKDFTRFANFKGKTYGDWKKFLLEGIDLDTISEEELISRTATAIYEGIQVKDALPKFEVDEHSEGIDELVDEWIFNNEEESLQLETKSTPDQSEVDPEKARQKERRRQQKQEQQKIDKALRKKGKKGKNRKRKKR
ncbi:hypothetical protein [Enterococcus sp. AZ109]|uniref:hypothetical protein n=1 Tax=Enterococcus sp. AZ109 TaxID=2774634 RepID=UPI003F226E34